MEKLLYTDMEYFFLDQSTVCILVDQILKLNKYKCTVSFKHENGFCAKVVLKEPHMHSYKFQALHKFL